MSYVGVMLSSTDISGRDSFYFKSRVLKDADSQQASIPLAKGYS